MWAQLSIEIRCTLVLKLLLHVGFEAVAAAFTACLH
jgi:hypothetical protein